MGPQVSRDLRESGPSPLSSFRNRFIRRRGDFTTQWLNSRNIVENAATETPRSRRT